MTRLTVLYTLMAAVLVGLIVLLLGVGQGALHPFTDPLDHIILLHFRAPRVALALVTGAGLGMAGTAVQTLLRNPLASPDIIGFSAGAAAGAALVIVMSGTGVWAGAGAVLGGCITAALVLALAWRGGIAPLPLVLIGVSLSLLLAAATDVLLSLAPDLQASEVTRFLSGSFAGAEWHRVGVMGCVTMIGGGLLGWQAFAIDRLRLGDDMARALGLGPDGVRIRVVTVSAVVVSVSVAVAGPIPFVAFLSGPLARQLSKQSGTVLLASAGIGAVLALGAEALSGTLIFGTHLPAGVFTALIGGPAMLGILLINTRER